MVMRVAVFGTSRSGKDYTIRDATELLQEKGMLFSHISPISMVHEELNGRKLRDLSDDEKNRMVSIVRHRMTDLLQDEYVFVDEHYCFPETFGGERIDNGYSGEKLPYRLETGSEGRSYEVVFNDDWLNNYEMVVYMDIDPCIILERFRTSEGVKRNLLATYEDVRLWQMFEIDHIQELCHSHGTPLYYIYDHEKTGEELSAVVRHCMKMNHRGVKT